MQSNAPKRLEKFFAIAANLAQVLMVLIVGGGYYYTVLPVFEKQKLSEDLSKLQIEKSSWESVLESKRREVEKLRNAEASILVSVEKLKAENSDAIEQRSKAEQSAKESLLRAAIAKRELQRAEEKYYELQRMELLGEVPISISFLEAFNLRRVSFDRDSTSHLAAELQESLVSPLEIAKKQAEQLSQKAAEAKNNLVKKTALRLKDEFNVGLKLRRENLVCTNPEPEAWKSAFEGSFPVPDSEVDSCVAMQFSHQQAKEGWVDAQVKKLEKGDFWIKQTSSHRSNCRYWLEMGVERLFNERWAAAIAPCRTRIMHVPSIILGSTVDPVDAPAFSSVSPPTEADVVAALREVVAGWYASDEATGN